MIRDLVITKLPHREQHLRAVQCDLAVALIQDFRGVDDVRPPHEPISRAGYGCHGHRINRALRLIRGILRIIARILIRHVDDARITSGIVHIIAEISVSILRVPKSKRNRNRLRTQRSVRIIDILIGIAITHRTGNSTFEIHVEHSHGIAPDCDIVQL